MTDTAKTISATRPEPRQRVRAMKEYYPPLGKRDLLRLDFNENTLDCSPRVREVLANVSAGALTRYPEREPVEAMVAAHLGIAAEQLVLTNGVDEAIHVLFETFLDGGDELLLPVPTYTMYEVYASATDARVVAIQAGDDLRFPFEELLSAITPKTKIVALANPNSPSGSAATREQLLTLARTAPHALVLVDEAYFHFHGETVIDLVGIIPNLVVARTFSKAFGLAGLRVGLLAGPVELMRWVRRVLSPYSVNSLGMSAKCSRRDGISKRQWVRAVCAGGRVAQISFWLQSERNTGNLWASCVRDKCLCVIDPTTRVAMDAYALQSERKARCAMPQKPLMTRLQRSAWERSQDDNSQKVKAIRQKRRTLRGSRSRDRRDAHCFAPGD